MNMRRILTEKLLLPLGDAVVGHPMMKRLAFLEEAQWWDREKVLAEQRRLLQNTIAVAYRDIPYYREQMQALGLSPGDIRGPEDLARLPINEKSMLRPRYPKDLTRDTGGKTWENSSSGSTGKNFIVLCDQETAGTYRADFLLALKWAGWQFGEPHMQSGGNPGRSPLRKLKDKLLGTHYVSLFHTTTEHYPDMLSVLKNDGVRHLWGYPSFLNQFAAWVLRENAATTLKSVVTWGDNLFPHYRANLEKAFGVRVHDTYGCGEGIQISAQCGHEGNYHLHDLDTVVEIVDDQGNPVPAGTRGHIILTRLHPGPMPLIRYRVGDLGILSDDPCPCGRGFTVMKKIEGRDTDVILTTAGEPIIVHVFTGLFEYFHEVDQFQVHQPEHGRIIVRIKPYGPYGPENTERIVQKLRENGLADLQIDVEIVDEIPTTASGKRRFVTSDIARRPMPGGEAQQTPS